MATLVLTAVGTAVGGPIGGAIGAVLGQSIDGALFAPKAREGPRLGELAVQTSSYGTPIPKLFGTVRVAGTVIWSTDLIERRSTSGGGKGRPKSVDYSYSASFAVALSARRVREVRRIWADGKLLRGAGGDFKVKTAFCFYDGDENQGVDPLIAAAEGSDGAPAFRGIAYAMFEELELAEFGNRIPSLTFEVVADAGPVEIGAIAAELAPEVAAGPTPAFGGYVASGGSVRGALEDAAELTGITLSDDGAVLRMVAPGGAAVLLPRARESGRRESVRRAAGSVPGEVTISYHDAGRDYQAGLQRAVAPGAAPGAQAERRALAAVLTADEAKALAERRLDALWAGRVSATVDCGWAAAGLRPGKLLLIEGEGGRWRVHRWTLGDMRVKLELVRETAVAAATAAGASPGRPISEPDLVHGPTTLRLYDLPLAEIGGGQPTLAALAAGSSPGWRGAQLSVSFDGGVSWRDIGGAAAPAVLGSAATVLPPGGSALFDHGSTVAVELLHEEMELEARDEDALVAGANLALIGKELVQFGGAERLGPRRFRLSRLLRGRRGTEWAAGAHQIGEDFALIDAASIRAIKLPAGAAAGTQVMLLASGVADDEAAAAARVATGEALRPPSPVHLCSEMLADGGVLISWVRRSRLGWGWASGSDTPLGEEGERYEIELAGSGGTRRAEVTESRFAYDPAARAADGPGPVIMTVVQLGTNGRSRPATITID